MPSQAKQRVVLAASRSFAQSGVSSTSMRDLARALNIQAPSLYSHFESKDALIRACVTDYVTACNGLRDSEGSLEDVLRLYGKVLDENRAAARILHYDPAIHDTEAGELVGESTIALHIMLTKRNVPDALAAPLLAMFREPWRRSTEVYDTLRDELIRLIVSTAQ